VFRELLQNSDDAGARSVEIRFETEEYLSREKGNKPQSDKFKQEDFPDLKTAVARDFLVVD
jgi:DNA mismatch repair ATPase MutL